MGGATRRRPRGDDNRRHRVGRLGLRSRGLAACSFIGRCVERNIRGADSGWLGAGSEAGASTDPRRHFQRAAAVSAKPHEIWTAGPIEGFGEVHQLLRALRVVCSTVKDLRNAHRTDEVNQLRREAEQYAPLPDRFFTSRRQAKVLAFGEEGQAIVRRLEEA